LNIPNLSNPTPIQPNPLTQIPHSGDHISWGELNVDFKVSEDLQNWLEIYNWIRETGFPTESQEYKDIAERPNWVGQGLKSDISILILNSSQVPVFECVLKDAFPISLTGFRLGSTDTDVNFVTCQATFVYTLYTMTAIPA
jgi:hypothetical protein